MSDFMHPLMVFAVLASSYAALAALCLSMDKHYETVFAQEPQLKLQRLLYWGGWLALLPALLLSIQLWGGAIGTVIWLGTLTLMLAVLALLLAYQQRLVGWSLVLTAPLVLLAVGLLLW